MVPTKDPALNIPLVVKIEHDHDPMHPEEGDGNWHLISFGRRHSNYRDPDEFILHFTEEGKPVARDKELRAKLRRGLAFWCSYYEHSGSVWSLMGEGPSCRWDSVRVAGLLVWEHPAEDMGAKTIKGRAEDARSFLSTYNAWANGEVYGYDIDDPEGDVEDSCWGYYGNDTEYMLRCIQDACGERPVIFKGDAAYIGEDYKGVTFDPDIHEAPEDED